MDTPNCHIWSWTTYSQAPFSICQIASYININCSFISFLALCCFRQLARSNLSILFWIAQKASQQVRCSEGVTYLKKWCQKQVFRISRWIFTMRPAQLATNSWSIIVDDSFLPTNGGWLPTLMTLAYKPLATLLLLMSPFSGKHNFLKAPFSMYLLGSVDDWQVTHWLAQPWVVLSRWGLHVIDKHYTLIARQKYICKPKNICWYCKTDYLLQQQQNNTVYIYIYTVYK